MIYSFSITTPANTPAANRQKTELKLTTGVIHQIDFVFPPGCAGLAFISVNDGLHQVWPTNPSQKFHTDGETISFEEFYKLIREPFILDAFTYNLDDTYDHEIIVRVGILKESEIQGVWLPWSEETIE